MNLDLDSCRAISGKRGLPLDFVVKEFQLFEVLRQVSSLTGSSRKLVFKGGTALNKVYLGELQRFSEDLDFDLIDATPSEAYVFSRSLASAITEFEVTNFRRVRATAMFSCAFDSPLGRKDHVRVDICGKKLKTLNPLEVGTATSTFVDRSVSGFLVYSLDDLVARKLNALIDRTEGKDIYDVAMAIDKTKNLKAAVQKVLESEEKRVSVEEFLDKAVKKLNKINPKMIKNLTNPLIPVPARPSDWAILIDTLTQKLEVL